MIALDPVKGVLKCFHIEAPNAEWHIEKEIDLNKNSDENIVKSSKLKAFYVGKMPHLLNIDKNARSPPTILKIGSDVSKTWGVLVAPRIAPNSLGQDTCPRKHSASL